MGVTGAVVAAADGPPLLHALMLMDEATSMPMNTSPTRLTVMAAG
jgi:hypothetical protein